MKQSLKLGMGGYTAHGLTSRMPNQDAFTPQIWNLRIAVVLWVAVTSLNHDVYAAVSIAF